MKYTHEFLKDMPKTDLHLHLDGSLRIPSLIEMAKNIKVELPSYDAQGLKDTVFKDKYQNLGEYLKGFKYTCDVLRDLENLERASYELAIDNQNEGVNYIEVRFAPQLLMNPAKNIGMKEILHRVNDGLLRAKNEYNQKKDKGLEFDYGIICCAMRMFNEKFSPYYSDIFKLMPNQKPAYVISNTAMELTTGAIKLRDEDGLPIVGIDLAGEEAGYPAVNFKDSYELAHRNFLNKTVHAGEAYGAESIFQAITDCYADRIGHGYSLFDSELIVHPKIKDKKKYIQNLASFIADKRITIEVCLTSNLQTNPDLKDIKDHHFKDMLENRMATTICTDNRLVSNTTVTDEYKLATDNFDIPVKILKDIVAYGFKKSFHSGSYVEKREYAKRAMNYFDQIAKKHNINL